MPCLHASAVSLDGRGILIIGPSGSGKSSLALELMAFGCALVADDQVMVDQRAGGLWLSAADAIANMIEARGVGLICANGEPARAALVVDLGTTETERLPEAHTKVIAGATLPLLRKVESPSFAAMLLAYLRGGRMQ
ncbi:MAG: HPr kinase/phosphorylase [Paracoccaceae bacterium]